MTSYERIRTTNEQCRELATVSWTSTFQGEDGSDLAGVFSEAAQISAGMSSATFTARAEATLFLTNCFRSTEVPLVRRVVLRHVSLPLWLCVTPARVAQELLRAPADQQPLLRRQWEAVQRKFASAPSAPERTLMPGLVSAFLSEMRAIDEDQGRLLYLGRFLELLIDLLSQMPTRRFFRLFVSDAHVVAVCKLSVLS
jgi:intron-binding protein aquarius